MLLCSGGACSTSCRCERKLPCAAEPHAAAGQQQQLHTAGGRVHEAHLQGEWMLDSCVCHSRIVAAKLPVPALWPLAVLRHPCLKQVPFAAPLSFAAVQSNDRHTSANILLLSVIVCCRSSGVLLSWQSLICCSSRSSSVVG